MDTLPPDTSGSGEVPQTEKAVVAEEAVVAGAVSRNMEDRSGTGRVTGGGTEAGNDRGTDGETDDGYVAPPDTSGSGDVPRREEAVVADAVSRKNTEVEALVPLHDPTEEPVEVREVAPTEEAPTEDASAEAPKGTATEEVVAAAECVPGWMSRESRKSCRTSSVKRGCLRRSCFPRDLYEYDFSYPLQPCEG